MTARGLWMRIGVSTVMAGALLVCVSPARPERRVPAPVAALAGAGTGALLFLGATRQVPRLSAARARTPVLLAEQGLLGLWAANEEIVWRRVVLGELLPAGVLVAFAVSSFGFAFAHRRRRALHLGTGAAFGGVYIATGWLGASVAAHWLYNALVGARLKRAPP
jgi:membrane protease YdiL (CAAX protease family)